MAGFFSVIRDELVEFEAGDGDCERYGVARGVAENGLQGVGVERVEEICGDKEIVFES